MTHEKYTWDAAMPSVPMVLAAPLQSWGHQSIFQRRNTLAFPTHSALVGIIAAAMAVDRNDPEHARKIRDLSSDLRFVVCRLRQAATSQPVAPVLEDYHTVENARTASGGTKATELTRRFYLQNSVFVVLMQGTGALLTQVVEALKDPVWGGWLGRRSCVPSLPMLPPGNWPALSASDAWGVVRSVLAKALPSSDIDPSWDLCPRVMTATSFADGTDTWLDVPENFDHSPRRYNARRVKVVPGLADSEASPGNDAFPSPLDTMGDEQ